MRDDLATSSLQEKSREEIIQVLKSYYGRTLDNYRAAADFDNDGFKSEYARMHWSGRLSCMEDLLRTLNAGWIPNEDQWL